MSYNQFKKVVVGERQMFRRVRKEKQKIDLEIHQAGALESALPPSSSPQSISIPTTTDHCGIPEHRPNSESSVAENILNSHTFLRNDLVHEYVSKSNEAKDLPSQLKHWATVEHKIPHNALDSLLKILNPLCPELPRDSRTLLNTPMTIPSISLQSGELVHIGLIHQKRAQLKLYRVTNFANREILLCFNVDGLPLFKSTNTQLWPI